MKVLKMTAGIRGRFIPPKCQTVADRLDIWENPNRNRIRKKINRNNIQCYVYSCIFNFIVSFSTSSETGKVLTSMQAGDFFGEIGILNLDGLNK
jgi:hypothetical protein